MVLAHLSQVSKHAVASMTVQTCEDPCRQGGSPFKAVVGVAAPVGQQGGAQGMQDSIVVPVGRRDDEGAGPHAA